MRPSKRILLIGENDFSLSPLRFMLSNSTPMVGIGGRSGSCYKVTTANSTNEALRTLANGEFDLMLCVAPIANLDHLMKRAKEINVYIPSMLLFEKESPTGIFYYADAVMHKPSNADLLERIRVMVARKRGPRKGWMRGVAPVRPVAREEVVA